MCFIFGQKRKKLPKNKKAVEFSKMKEYNDIIFDEGVLRMGLFQKEIEPYCTYCSRGRPLGENQVLCPKKGVMAANSHCRSFRYDPLKRVPPRPAKLIGAGASDEEFQL